MKQKYDLSSLNWTAAGFVPYEWQLGKSMELGSAPKADVPAIPAPVPGSVQKALLDAGILPDWNIGFNARLCEWVENRHWLYRVELTDEWFVPNCKYRLKIMGLDYCGEIFVNNKSVCRFQNTFIPYTVDLTEYLRAENNILEIMFECPPRWMGQFYYTSKIKDYKPRYNYTWDWTSRLVQIGIHDSIFIEVCPSAEIADLHITTDYDCDKNIGLLKINGSVSGASENQINVTLSKNEKIIQSESFAAEQFNKKGLIWNNLTVDKWWPNGLGEQPLYQFEISIEDKNGQIIDVQKRTVGFKNIQWQPCEDAPPKADLWICAVNGRPIFLQGVNWTPIRPNFADVTERDYRRLLEIYRQIGCNILRVWGGAFLERQCFYDICDELGIMIWQEFPLSSSGLENYPPEDPKVIDEFCEIAESYIARCHHHVSLLLWSGGNELTTISKDIKPLDESHPLLGRLGELVRKKDSQHRFVATSPTGPEFFAHHENYGKGLHWDIHGPWKVDGLLNEQWQAYWQNDDSLFRSELGAPGPSSVELIRKYKGDCEELPADLSNPVWSRTGWWAEGETFEKEFGRKPQSLEEYVQWGQHRQATILKTAVKSCKDRFPKCGGVILWMGHDCFPCMANTAIIDFEGNPKPAAVAVAEIFKSNNQKV
jgi:beta-mannosidase